jgi:hypothetical protein
MPTSKITPSCQYGFTDTVWRGTKVGSDASSMQQRNLFGGKASIYSITYATTQQGVANDYIKIYDSLAALDSNGSLTAPVLILPVYGANTTTMTFPDGLPFTTGVTVRATVEAGTAGTTAPVGDIYLSITVR